MLIKSTISSFPSEPRLDREVFVADNLWSDSLAFKWSSKLEKYGIRDEWFMLVRSKLVDRLQQPRHGLPGVNDRAPPPPKTLHWKYAPAEGEHAKMRAILCWASLHVWLLRWRIPEGHGCEFLVEQRSFDFLYNELVSVWLPDASIPSFSLKGEANRLVAECRESVAIFSTSRTDFEFTNRVWTHGYKDRGFVEGDPIISDLYRYVLRQKSMLASLPLKCLLQDDKSWHWIDTVDKIEQVDFF